MPPLPNRKPVYVYGPRDKVPSDVTLINTTSHSRDFGHGLSPFFLGPVKLYGDYVSLTVENGWQYSKLYEEHTDGEGNPTDKYWEWALDGWSNKRAVRYPMGKGAKPICSLWGGERIGYIEARKRIYVPLYTNAVRITEEYKLLKEIYLTEEKLGLWDFNGYNYLAMKMSLEDVLYCEERKMGHAFVLAMLLEGVTIFLKPGEKLARLR